MQNQTESSPDKDQNSLSQLAQSMFNYNSNNNINDSTIMLAAIVSLLLVILFVLLLHVYAKWFLSHSNYHQQSNSQSRRRRRRRRGIPPTVSGVMRPSQFHHFNMEDSPFSTKGLDSATVSAIPLFVYEAEETGETEELECVICLSGFEDGEIGRSLPKCGHVFHVECIDMWLSSHSNCPICRAPIASGVVLQNDSQLGSVDGDDGGDGNDDGDGDHGVLEIVIGTPSYEISESERGNDNFGGGSSVPESGSSLLLGSSLKRMLSKVFVSNNVVVNNGFDGS